MRRISFLAIAVVVAAVSSCLKYEDSPLSDSDLGGVRITGYTESRDTRSAVVDGGTTVYWEKEDEIKVFSGESSARFVSCNSTIDVTAEFAGPSGFSIKSGEGIAAVYPYSEDAAWDGETFTLTLPSEQVACAGSFARGMNIAVAKSEDNSTLQFRNVGGGVRFSVKEEGVKKVIFEGLDGEAIAGKVKIGFEAGIPVVKEVTEARQFITLTAPEGKAFEVGKWYYIVAIPGALDKGYKLRFYKDDTYARLTSEKSVQVKRSVFGSVADADEGVEYEAQEISFPKNEAEVRLSINIMDDICNKVDDIINMNMSSDGTVDADAVAIEISTIENVKTAYSNKNGSSVIVQQKDGVYFNVSLSSIKTMKLEEDSPQIKMYVNTQKKSDSFDTPVGRKALILAPFRFYFDDYLNEVQQFLTDAGYYVKMYENDEVDKSILSADIISQYDVIIINTHGGADGMTVDGNATESYLATGIRSRSIYDIIGLSERTVSNFTKEIILSVPPDGDRYISVDTSILDDTDLENKFVLLLCCQSSGFAKKFYDQKASIAIGFSDDANEWITANYSYYLFDYMTCGCSFGKTHDAFLDWLSRLEGDRYYQQYKLMRDKGKVYNRFPDQPFFLNDYTPTNLRYTPNGTNVKLEWDCTLSRAKLKYYVTINDEEHEVPQSIFGNHGEYNFSGKAGVEYHWKVSAVSSFGDTFESGEKSFTIEGQTGGGETMLNSRTYGGKTYSIIRKNESKTDYRVNGDGSKFYKNSFSVKVDNTTYDIPGTYYSYETDRNSKDLGPALAVNKTTGDMWLFLIEKDVDEYYGMCGYIIKISKGSYSKTTVFTQANFGWFPFFGHQDGSLVLNCFSYAGYFSLISFEDEDWALYMWYDIMPDDFKALQDQNEIIYIF